MELRTNDSDIRIGKHVIELIGGFAHFVFGGFLLELLEDWVFFLLCVHRHWCCYSCFWRFNRFEELTGFGGDWFGEISGGLIAWENAFFKVLGLFVNFSWVLHSLSTITSQHSSPHFLDSGIEPFLDVFHDFLIVYNIVSFDFFLKLFSNSLFGLLQICC